MYCGKPASKEYDSMCKECLDNPQGRNWDSRDYDIKVESKLKAKERR